jgi:putative ABC transport system permease protein
MTAIATAFVSDLRIALRVLRRQAGATLLAVLSMALGIGLTTGMFSVADAVYVRPLAIRDPAGLYVLSSYYDDMPMPIYGWPEYETMARAAGDRATFIALQRRGSTLTLNGEEYGALTHSVTPNYFQVLGVSTVLGRPSVEPIEGRPAVVLGHHFWQQRFGGDPHVVGSTITLNRKAFTVAGIMEPGYTGLNRGVLTDVWMSTDAWFDVFGKANERIEQMGQFEILARLAPGVNPKQLAATLDTVLRGQGKRRAAPAGTAGTFIETPFARPWKTELILAGGLLFGLGLVLFVACANVVQLRLAQAEARRHELAVRMSLGAGVGQLARLLAVETALTAVAGAALGLIFAQWIQSAGAVLFTGGVEWRDYGIGLDRRVMLFALGATVFAAAFAALLPLRHVRRVDVNEILKSGRDAGEAKRFGSRVLVAGQVAVTVAVCGLTLLMVQTLWSAAGIRPGFEPSRQVLAMGVSMRGTGDTADARNLCERLAGLPGVRAATFARRLPLSGSGGGLSVPVSWSGHALMRVHLNNVGAGYFSVMGAQMVAGRAIGDSDRAGSEPVVVVSRQLASMIGPGTSALGQWINVQGRPRLIVGIAEDGPSNDLHEAPEPFLYVPFAQQPSGDLTLMIETAGAPATLAPALRTEIRRYDSTARIGETITLRDQMDRALAEDRARAATASALGIFAAVLTGAGLFGFLLYTVQRRRREFGVRIAMGARPADVLRVVLARALRIAAWGIPVGLFLLYAASRSLASEIPGMTPLSWLQAAIGAAAALLLALLAAAIPARRAARTDPLNALRLE